MLRSSSCEERSHSKAATRGNWQDVWSSFDQRQKAKGAAANETVDDGPGLFAEDGSAGAQAAE